MRPNERLLREVGCQLWISNLMLQHAIDVGLAVPNKGVKGLRVTTLRLSHEFGIRLVHSGVDLPFNSLPLAHR